MDALERRQQLFRNRPGHSSAGGPSKPRRFGAAGLLLFLSLGAAVARADPAPPTPPAVALSEVGPLVSRDLAAGHVPGAVVVIGTGGHTIFRQAFGYRSLEPTQQPLSPDDIFDLASLTKVVGTTTAVMQLWEAGRVDLDAPVALYWPAFAANGKSKITVRELLTHTSGLPADLNLSESWDGMDAGLERVAAMRPAHPAATAFVYSDLNFIALGAIVSRVSGETLDGYLQSHVFGPLDMPSTGFDPPLTSLARIVATDREQGRLRWGQVQDPTAFRMGGVAGHAGLFSSADDLTRFARMLLGGGELDGVRILKPETVALMTTAVLLPGGARRGLGWDMSSAYSVGMDKAFGSASFGHTGYTGCSLWIDPGSQSYLIVLTSRLHPDDQGDVKPLRQDLGRLVGGFVSGQHAQGPLADITPAPRQS